MKILTWNINGIRAVQRDKTELKKILDSLDAHVICLQETKVTRDMLDEPTAVVENYESYFGFSRKKTGYSGTANFCQMDSIPFKAEEGLTGRLTIEIDDSVGHYCNTNCFTPEELDALDDEGRCVITQHKIRLQGGEIKELAIINVYIPLAGDREDRFEYKLKFLTLLQLRAESLIRSGIHVIVLGDLNITHTKKDRCETEANKDFLRQTSRIWLNQFLQVADRDSSIAKTDGRLAEIPALFDAEGGHFSDVFRRLHPDKEDAFTNWCTLTGARQTNYGRRLDYILVDKQLAQHTTECRILADVHGSDHCPVVLTLDCTSVPSPSSPSLCSKFMPEFRGQQKKLSAFFSKVSSSSTQVDITECDNNNTNSKNGALHSTSPTDRKAAISPLKSFSSAGASLKRQNLSKGKTQVKKVKLQKEDSNSKQISLKFFYNSTANTSKSKNKLMEKRDTKEQLSTIPSTFSDNSNRVELVNSDVIHVNDSSSSGRSEVQNGFSDLSNSSKSDMSKEITVIYSDSKTPKLSSSSSDTGTSALHVWKNILGGLPPPPLCPGHKEPSVLRTVKKEGPNKNKQFYVCSKPDGAPGNPLSRCDFFKWLNIKKR